MYDLDPFLIIYYFIYYIFVVNVDVAVPKGFPHLILSRSYDCDILASYAFCMLLSRIKVFYRNKFKHFSTVPLYLSMLD